MTGAEPSGSGFFVLDVDPDKGGADSLARLIAEHGPLPVTAEQKTGSGGRHYLFRIPPTMTITNAGIAKGLDIRGEGGLIVAAPSVSGKGGYSWIPGRAPWEGAGIVDSAPWLLALLGKAGAGRAGPIADGARGYFPPASPEVLDAAREALRAHGPAVTGESGGLRTMQAGAILTHDYALDDEESFPLFLEWNETCRPPWEPDELRVMLERGRKYGKLPYGCRRTLDTVTAARKMIRDWQEKQSDDPSTLIALVRELQWDDPTKREIIQHDLKAATGVSFKTQNLPPAIDLEEARARGEREQAFALGSAELLDPSEPLDVARRFQRASADAEGRPEIARWQETFWRARGTHYEPVTDEAIHASLYEFTDGRRDVKNGAPVKPDRSMIEVLAHALRAVAFAQVDAMPAWLDVRPADPDPSEIVAFPNGLLTLTAPRRFLPGHARRYFNANALAFPYDPKPAPPVNWRRFLTDVWGDDVESIETLQEIFGLLLTSDTRHQKIFMIQGPKRSGKGTLLRVLRALIGDANYTAPTLNALGGQFGAEPLIGKRVAVIPDARLTQRTDIGAVAERLLSISGEDAQSIDRKNKTAWTGKLDVRFLMTTNELPALVDQSGALASRFIILQMTRTFFGREDHGLTARLLMELPGILAWALNGLDRLRVRGYFRQPASAREAVDQLDALASPIKAFIAERCEVVPGATAECGALFSAWCRWCEKQGRREAGTLAIFSRNLRAALPQVTITRPRIDGEQVKRYEGIRVRVEDLRAA